MTRSGSLAAAIRDLASDPLAACCAVAIAGIIAFATTAPGAVIAGFWLMFGYGHACW